MQLIKAIFAELLSLFVDDSNLALQVLALVAAVKGLVKLAVRFADKPDIGVWVCC